jgi:hypothetical protein
MNEDLTYYFEDNGFIRCLSPKWEHEEYGFFPNGIGDVLFRTAHYALIEGDEDMLFRVGDQLMLRQRWPNFMMEGNKDRFAKNRFQYKRSKCRYKTMETQYRLFSPQNRMSRDPFIMFYCATNIMNTRPLFKIIKPVWYNWRPPFNSWYRYLFTKNRIWKWWYEFTEIIGLMFNPPPFAVYLAAWKAYTADSSKVKRMIGLLTPHWNYCIRQLIHHPLRHLDRTFISHYKPRFGFVWQGDEGIFNSDKVIKNPPPGRYLDKDILIFVYNSNRFDPHKKGWDMMKHPWWEKLYCLFNWRKHGVKMNLFGIKIKLHPVKERPIYAAHQTIRTQKG